MVPKARLIHMSFFALPACHIILDQEGVAEWLMSRLEKLVPERVSGGSNPSSSATSPLYYQQGHKRM